MSNANEEGRQLSPHWAKVAKDKPQHWDRMWERYREAWFVGNITKYVERYRNKDGLEDLKKARNYLNKLIELETAAATVDNTPALPVLHYAKEDHGKACLSLCGKEVNGLVATKSEDLVTCPDCLAVMSQSVVKTVHRVDTGKIQQDHVVAYCGRDVTTELITPIDDVTTCPECKAKIKEMES